MTATLSHPRYRLDRLIATGGMGEVWSATDTLLDREVAVKLMKREYADDPVFRARFAAEARHAGALQHPHVAAVLDYGELPGEDQARVPFLVMELVEGQSLSTMLAGGLALAPAVATELIAQAAEGLAAAHAIGIVHRDVKPGNLLVTADGQVKVTDFGVARAADTVPLTVTGQVVGTPHYLAPEQALGQAATPASDVYSLGVVLFECLVGAKPFVGDSPVATALMQLREPLPPFPPDVPGWLQEVARAATVKDPARRIPGGAELAAALRDPAPDTHDLPVAAPGVAVAAARPVGSAELWSGSSAAPPPREYVARRRFPWLILAGVLVLLLVGILVVSAVLDEDPPSGPGPTAGPDLVRVRAAAYVGLPVVEAAQRLRQRGFDVRTIMRDNPGAEPPATVAAMDPAGMVERGSEIILTVWRDPVQPSDPATGGSSGSADTPAGSGGSAGPDAPSSGSGGSGGGDTPGDAKADKPGSNGEGGQGKPDHAGKPGKPDEPGKPDGPGGPGKGKPGKGGKG